jgi:hypothetical protein
VLKNEGSGCTTLATIRIRGWGVIYSTLGTGLVTMEYALDELYTVRLYKSEYTSEDIMYVLPPMAVNASKTYVCSAVKQSRKFLPCGVRLEET